MRITNFSAMRALLSWSLCLVLLAAAGCSHYRLGTEGKLSFHSLYIAPVENQARVPQAVAIVTAQIRDAFIRDGRVALVNSPDEADAVLTIKLSSYARNVATSRPEDTGLARKFNLALTAICTLRENHGGAPLLEDRPIEVEQQIFATATPQQLDSNQGQAEYQALPQLAAKLADRTVHTTLDVW
jgi:hypothetical protein